MAKIGSCQFFGLTGFWLNFDCSKTKNAGVFLYINYSCIL